MTTDRWISGYVCIREGCSAQEYREAAPCPECGHQLKLSRIELIRIDRELAKDLAMFGQKERKPCAA